MSVGQISPQSLQVPAFSATRPHQTTAQPVRFGDDEADGFTPTPSLLEQLQELGAAHVRTYLDATIARLAASRPALYFPEIKGPFDAVEQAQEEKPVALGDDVYLSDAHLLLAAAEYLGDSDGQKTAEPFLKGFKLFGGNLSNTVKSFIESHDSDDSFRKADKKLFEVTYGEVKDGRKPIETFALTDWGKAVVARLKETPDRLAELTTVKQGEQQPKGRRAKAKAEDRFPGLHFVSSPYES